MAKRHKHKGLKLLALAIIAAAAGWVYLQRQHNQTTPAEKPVAVYKTEDRHKLERMIHEGTKHD